MLYGNISISHCSPSNMLIWLAMGFQGGLLNVGGLMAGHHIVSHVTGIVTNFGFSLGKGEIGNAGFLLVVPIFFLFGSMISGYFVDLRTLQGKKPKYYLSFGIMLVLLVLIYMLGSFGFFNRFGENGDLLREFILLALLCLVCGVQNGTITAVSKSVVRTTHLTGITTDLGIGIVRTWNRKSIKGLLLDEGRANLVRIGIIFSFGLGAGVGGVLFGLFQYNGFILPIIITATLFLVMLYYQKINFNVH